MDVLQVLRNGKRKSFYQKEHMAALHAVIRPALTGKSGLVQHGGSIQD
jgi:hypothetical protein